MKTPLLIAVVILGVLTGSSRADVPEPYIADSPDQVRPLLIGAQVPDVTLATPEHQPVVLRDALARQPTILIYYRGGW